VVEEPRSWRGSSARASPRGEVSCPEMMLRRCVPQMGCAQMRFGQIADVDP
jgi:hypothetical protein